MIPLDRLLDTLGGLQRGELEHWIAEDLVRPERSGEELLFGDIELARVRLLMELRHDMRVDEEALPVVVSLIDQLYAARRRMRLLVEAIDRSGDDLQQAVVRELRRSIDAGET